MFRLALGASALSALALSGVSAEDEVPKLPGATSPTLTRKMYAGFAQSDKKTDGNLYYVFHESSIGKNADGSSDASVDEDDIPLIIWLNGGPGASSSLGNYLENGPYAIDVDSPGSLKKNDANGWHSLGHLIYFDQPVGTGFSYCDTVKNPSCFVGDYDTLGKQFVTALVNLLYKKEWAVKMGLSKKRLYMTGESFGGVYVPVIANAIHDYNQIAGHKEKGVTINMHGVFVGNPVIRGFQAYPSSERFFRSHGLLNAVESKEYIQPMLKKCKDELEKETKEAETSNTARNTTKSFLLCEDAANKMLELAGNPFVYDIRKFGDIFAKSWSPLLEKFLTQEGADKLLNTRGEPWKNGDGAATAGNNVSLALQHLYLNDNSHYYERLLNFANDPKFGYTFAIYDGVMDGSTCNHIEVYDAALHMKWSAADEWNKAEKKILRLNESDSESVYGYMQAGGGLHFLWMLNSGHLVPTDQPAAAHHMLRMLLGMSKENKAEDVATGGEQMIIA